MKNLYLFLLLFLTSSILTAQIVINEFDTDTPSTDTKEFIELKSDTPYFALDGYVVVLFNGNGDLSYYTIDLDGYTTDINGLLLIGSNEVSPVPQLLIPPAIFQNGADAVAVYLGSYFDFPEDTLATSDNLIDALLYDTDDADDTGLMALLGVTVQTNENLNGNKLTESIQRNNDGTYFVGTPTPRLFNDGSGVVLNGVSMSIPLEQYNEGESFDILFTTEQNVTEALSLNFSLNNAGFNESDYTGNISPVIPVGQNSVSTTISLVDDTSDEGDEVLIVNLAPLADDYLILNNNSDIRVVDNDFVVADWGIPTNPTFGVVTSTQPDGYYDSLEGLADVALRQAMQDIIANPAIVRAQTYADIIDILKEADQNPANSNQVWLVYTEQGRAKLDFQTTSDNTGKWNREHTFPRSRAGYDDIEADEFADGVDSYWTTNADSLRHGNSDAHALRAADGPENSSRGNKNYGIDEYDGPTGNAGSFYGDVARSVLYMTVRYNGLAVVDGYPGTDPLGQLGDLTTLLDWHRNDPPDDFEMNRNNVVYTWQFNRNPFIDYPDLVEYIWGTEVGNTWSQPLAVQDNLKEKVRVFPNPTKNKLTISGITGKFTIELFSTDGRSMYKQTSLNTHIQIPNLASGLYLIKISSGVDYMIQKIVIN